jgi:hypothetical protein
MASAIPDVVDAPAPPKMLTLSARKRALLHRLLHRDLRRCSIPGLAAFERRGWVFGMNGDYQLTGEGRRIAELSEKLALDADMDVPMP